MSDLSSTAWNEHYTAGNTPWDIGTPTPEFVRVLERRILPTKGRVLVPGGGRGHDAIHLAQKGYEVDLVDFAPAALEAALQQAAHAKVNVHAFQLDFFQLDRLPYHKEAYDLFLEYTFFCAIDPSLRKRYVEVAARVLKPGGWLVGLFFPLATDKAGPPFLVSREEVEALFSPYFHLQIEKPEQSVKPRAGREFLGLFQKKQN